MTRPMIRIHNVETNEVIDREMNEEEYAQHLKDVEAFELQLQAKAEAEAKRESALAKLAALGLNTDDLKALGL